MVAVVFRPFHRLDTAVMTVAAPDDPSVGPVFAQVLRHVLDDGPHLRALRGARRAQDGRHRRAATPLAGRCREIIRASATRPSGAGPICRPPTMSRR